jgi:hypothetical protein
MDAKSRKLQNRLEEVSREGALMYLDGKLSSPEEIAKSRSVCEEITYMPDFVVIDEGGNLKEVWYEKRFPNQP